MCDITIDTQILLFSDDPKASSSIYAELLDAIESRPFIHLAVDDEGLIWKEYDDKIKATRFGRRLLGRLLANRRIKRVPRIDVPRPAKAKFVELRFDKSDQKFVRAAASTDSKRLVAEERHYAIRRVRSVIKDHFGVDVQDARRAKEEICANQPR